MIQPRNHREWGPHQFKVLVWAVKVVRGSAFFNLLFASRASIIVLPALCWAARGRLEGESTQNMTLSLFTSCSLLPSIEGAGEEGEMQSCAAACRANSKKGRKTTMIANHSWLTYSVCRTSCFFMLHWDADLTVRTKQLQVGIAIIEVMLVNLQGWDTYVMKMLRCYNKLKGDQWWSSYVDTNKYRLLMDNFMSVKL